MHTAVIRRWFQLRAASDAGRRNAAPRNLVSALLLFWSLSAAAQAQPAFIPSGPPQQPQEGPEIERRIQPAPPVRPAPPPTVPTPEAAPAAPAVSRSFVVAAVVIDGATVFDTPAFVPLYRDLLARPVDQRDLARLAEAITGMYYDAGYTLSRAYVPPQDVESGIVHVRVAEGFIERVEIGGQADVANDLLVRRYVAPLTGERPLKRATLEKQLLLLSDLFGVRVDDARLRPIDPGEGRYELALDLHVKAVDTYSYLDNRGTRANGRFELWNSVGVNVLNDSSWRAQGAFFTVPDTPRELLYGQATLSRIVGDAGTVVRGTLSASRSVAGPAENAQDNESSSRRFLLGATHPLIRSRAQGLWASLYFDVLQSKEDQFKDRFFRDELRVLRSSVYYYLADGVGGENGINLEGSLGLNVLGASSSGPLRSRTDASGSFAKLRLDAWRNQSLFGPWSLYAQVVGQTSDRPLLLSETLALGGSRFGRGYDPSIISGDRGAAGSLEFRFTEPLAGPLRQYQLYGFYDIGAISNGSGDDPPGHQVSSAGFGGRLMARPAFYLNLELAKPLTSVPSQDNHPWRVFMFASAEF